jgi:hypothetical protein
VHKIIKEVQVKYQELKEEIKSIAEISESVPESFKEKCFEILMKHLLDETEKVNIAQNSLGSTVTGNSNEESQTENMNSSDESNSNNGVKSEIQISAQLRVFMRKTDITIDEIGEILHYDNGAIYFVLEPKDKIVSKGQIKWALLLALKNGIISKDFNVDPEDLRSICQDKGYYDVKNFSRYLKNNSSYFKNPIIPQGEAQSLSDEGMTALAKLIKELNSSEK